MNRPCDELSLRHPCVIVDIDGTLSNAEHRVHLIAEKKWPEFYDLCHLDSVHNHIAVIVNLLADRYRIVLTTGRVERVRNKTEAWLNKNGITYHELLMRPDGDFRPDDVLKEEILDRDILPLFNPVFSLDDREKVVAMWRRRGIPCLQVATGDF